jgi:hypothetical protein
LPKCSQDTITGLIHLLGSGISQHEGRTSRITAAAGRDRSACKKSFIAATKEVEFPHCRFECRSGAWIADVMQRGKAMYFYAFSGLPDTGAQDANSVFDRL